MRKLLSLCLLLSSFLFVKGQGTAIGFFGGGMNYKGDLSPKQALSIRGLNGAVGLKIKQDLDGHWVLNLQSIAGKITGDDRDFEDRQAYRQLDVTTILIELVTTVEWHPIMRPEVIPQGSPLLDHLSPYLYFGIGVVFADVAVRGLPDKAPELVRGLNNGTYMSIPLGIGLNFQYNKRWSFDLEGGVRFPTTDNLDGISINRNPNINDWYYVLGISANMKISVKK